MKLRVVLTAIIALIAFGPVLFAQDMKHAGFDLSSLEDGWYRAEEAFDGSANWRNIVWVEVSRGKIVDALWTAASKTGGPDKYQ